MFVVLLLHVSGLTLNKDSGFVVKSAQSRVMNALMDVDESIVAMQSAERQLQLDKRLATGGRNQEIMESRKMFDEQMEKFTNKKLEKALQAFISAGDKLKVEGELAHLGHGTAWQDEEVFQAYESAEQLLPIIRFQTKHRIDLTKDEEFVQEQIVATREALVEAQMEVKHAVRGVNILDKPAGNVLGILNRLEKTIEDLPSIKVMTELDEAYDDLIKKARGLPADMANVEAAMNLVETRVYGLTDMVSTEYTKIVLNATQRLVDELKDTKWKKPVPVEFANVCHEFWKQLMGMTVLSIQAKEMADLEQTVRLIQKIGDAFLRAAEIAADAIEDAGQDQIVMKIARLLKEVSQTYNARLQTARLGYRIGLNEHVTGLLADIQDISASHSPNPKLALGYLEMPDGKEQEVDLSPKGKISYK